MSITTFHLPSVDTVIAPRPSCVGAEGPRYEAVTPGLAVIGAIIGEFIAGIGGLRGGLGYLIVSAANRLEMSYLFAAALSSSLLGIVIFVGINFVSARFLRHWHESAVQREN